MSVNIVLPVSRMSLICCARTALIPRKPPGQQRTMTAYISSFVAWGLVLRSALAATCSLTPSYGSPRLATGWSAQLVAQGISDPRSIVRDGEGNLLVLSQGRGIIHLRLDDGGGTCVDVEETTNLVVNEDVRGSWSDSSCHGRGS